MVPGTREPCTAHGRWGKVLAPTDHGGAICDIMTRDKAQKLGLDAEAYLADNDSYHFFSRTGDYLMMGYTGSNVSDFIIAIKE